MSLEIISTRGEEMKDKLSKFLKENGFLLFLFACVCIVAVSTIFILTKEVGNPREDELVILDQKKNQMEDKSEDKKEVHQDKEEEEELPDKEKGQDMAKIEKEDNPQDKLLEDQSKEVFADEGLEEEIEFIEDVVTDNVATREKFILPIDGEIITKFTDDTLVYSETLSEWRAHLGIDIRGQVGSIIKAAADGVVKEVYEDPLWGNVVLIDHGNGLFTKYANLGNKSMVEPGLKVRQGEEIGTIGETANIEMLMEPHLHFEAIKDGKNVDPRSIR
ncbi:MAG TPA: M23 family metallopeptidase [Tissierellaceae bacterium]|nr:M23 family metallopeptidase [Tissierellaceae bacterium]